MELSSANIKKPRFWLELPLEIGRAVCKELLLEFGLMLNSAVEPDYPNRYPSFNPPQEVPDEETLWAP